MPDMVIGVPMEGIRRVEPMVLVPCAMYSEALHAFAPCPPPQGAVIECLTVIRHQIMDDPITLGTCCLTGYKVIPYQDGPSERGVGLAGHSTVTAVTLQGWHCPYLCVK